MPDTPATMTAARIHDFGDPEVIRIEEVPVPEPGPGEVRVKVRAAALNHLDLWVRRGLPIEIEMPHVGGSDIAGTVDALGDEVFDEGAARIGARVVVDPSLHYVDPIRPADEWSADPSSLRLIGEHVDGGFAQYAIVPAANLVELPEGVSFEVAAAGSLAGVTAWRATVTRGRIGEGDTVLVTGASGGVSTMAIQFAKGRGARVLALTSTPWTTRVGELGADVVLDRLEGDWVGRAREWLKESGGAHSGVDVVVDSVGAAVWKDAVRLLAPGGRMVSYGATTGAKVEIDLRHHFWKQTEFLGSTMGSSDEYREAMREVFRERAVPVVHGRMPLSELAEAHRRLEKGDVFGKIVIRPWD